MSGEILGWISTLCLALCSIPLVWDAIEEGRSDVNSWFLGLWLVGEIAGLVYCVILGSYPLIANYGFNTAMLFILTYYRSKP